MGKVFPAALQSLAEADPEVHALVEAERRAGRSSAWPRAGGLMAEAPPQAFPKWRRRCCTAWMRTCGWRWARSRAAPSHPFSTVGHSHISGPG